MPYRQGLIFMHIPKTAGKTLHGIITRQYSWQKHFGVPNLPSMEKFKRLSEAERYRYSVVRGHLDASILDYTKPGLPVITFFRNPERRIISAYEFIRKSKNHKFYAEMQKNNYSLYDFLSGKYIKNFDNGQVRFLSGAHDDGFGTINETHLAKAKDALDCRITTFGITEKFDESILHISKVLNWKTPLYTINNVNEKYTADNYPLDAQTKNKIRECTIYDELLYQYAVDKFNQLIISRGAVFQDEVVTFKKLNVNKTWWFRLTAWYFNFRINRSSR